MNASELLSNSLSHDAKIRSDATEKLEQAARENFPVYVTVLSTEVANEGAAILVRTAASIALKNTLTARDYTRQAENTRRWLNMDEGAKAKVKQDVLTTLNTSQSSVSSHAAQVIAAVAAIELPEGQWADLIPILLQFVNQAGNDNLRVAALQTIGFLCESVKADVLAAHSNEILTAVVQGARQAEPNENVVINAMKALSNSLEFVRDNFEREGERNYLMQVVCEATQHQSTEVKVRAFECLVRIMGLYYDKMGFYMERALFGLTIMGMKDPEEGVALQAIEFWSTVCEEEIELNLDALEAEANFAEPSDRESKKFALTALPEILPVILRLLMTQEEDADEDEWNISMAAGTCLSLLARAVNNPIVQLVIPFIEENIQGADWHQREAAVMAFGSILDGPEPSVLVPLVEQGLGHLIAMLKDTSPQVKDTTAWTLGVICDLMISHLNPAVHLEPLVSALLSGLNDKPKISANCSWSLMNLVEQLHNIPEDEPTPPSSGTLSPYYVAIVDNLLVLTQQPTNEANYRTAAYEALAAYVTQAPFDCLSQVSKIVLTVLERQEHLLKIQSELLGGDDHANWNELQTNLCSILVAAIRKSGKEIKSLADRIMTNVLGIVSSAGKNSTTLEDAFLLLGTMAIALEQDVQPYIPTFLQYLQAALRTTDDSQLCTVAIGVIGDICRALGDSAVPYCDGFMAALFESLQSSTLNRTVKISVLTCFGDIALAISGGFEPYVESTMAVLRQAGEISPDPNDYDLLDYVQSLREGIIEAYVGIVSALRANDKARLLLPHVGSMLELVQRTLTDEDRTESVVKLAVGLIGDLADCFKNGEIRDFLLASWVINNLKAKYKGYSGETRRTIKWAREMVKIATGNQINV